MVLQWMLTVLSEEPCQQAARGGTFRYDLRALPWEALRAARDLETSWPSLHEEARSERRAPNRLHLCTRRCRRCDGYDGYECRKEYSAWFLVRGSAVPFRTGVPDDLPTVPRVCVLKDVPTWGHNPPPG